MARADFEVTVLSRPQGGRFRTMSVRTIDWAIKDCLQDFDEVSASHRLKALFTDHIEALRVVAACSPSRGCVRSSSIEMPSLISRNAPPSTNTRNPEHVLRYNFVLRLLLEACFQKVMGFTLKEIATLAHRSETYRQLKVRFFRDVKTPAEEPV